jgi:hypothetical protein
MSTDNRREKTIYLVNFIFNDNLTEGESRQLEIERLPQRCGEGVFLLHGESGCVLCAALATRCGNGLKVDHTRK